MGWLWCKTNSIIITTIITIKVIHNHHSWLTSQDSLKILTFPNNYSNRSRHSKAWTTKVVVLIKRVRLCMDRCQLLDFKAIVQFTIIIIIWWRLETSKDTMMINMIKLINCSYVEKIGDSKRRVFKRWDSSLIIVIIVRRRIIIAPFLGRIECCSRRTQIKRFSCSSSSRLSSSKEYIINHKLPYFERIKTNTQTLKI